MKRIRGVTAAAALAVYLAHYRKFSKPLAFLEDGGASHRPLLVWMRRSVGDALEV